jgi:hypothetical protein
LNNSPVIISVVVWLATGYSINADIVDSFYDHMNDKKIDVDRMARSHTAFRHYRVFGIGSMISKHSSVPWLFGKNKTSENPLCIALQA